MKLGKISTGYDSSNSLYYSIYLTDDNYETEAQSLMLKSMKTKLNTKYLNLQKNLEVLEEKIKQIDNA